MPTLQLTNSPIRPIIDSEDYPKVKHIRWSHTNNYVQGYDPQTRKHVYLHRYILSAKPGDEVQFLNRVRHDCRRANLKLTTRARNSNRRRLPSTGIPGILYVPEVYMVRWVSLEGKLQYVGRFRTRAEAEVNKPKNGTIWYIRPRFRVQHPTTRKHLGITHTLEEAKILQQRGRRKGR